MFRYYIIIWYYFTWPMCLYVKPRREYNIRIIRMRDIRVFFSYNILYEKSIIRVNINEVHSGGKITFGSVVIEILTLPLNIYVSQKININCFFSRCIHYEFFLLLYIMHLNKCKLIFYEKSLYTSRFRDVLP